MTDAIWWKRQPCTIIFDSFRIEIFYHITYTYFSNDWVIAWLFLQMHMMIRFSLFYLYVPNTYIVDTDLGSTQIRKQVQLLVSIIGINVLVILGIQSVSFVITEKNSAQRTLTMQRKNMETASSVLCSASKFMALPVALLKFRCKYTILTKKVRKATTNKHTNKKEKNTPPQKKNQKQKTKTKQKIKKKEKRTTPPPPNENKQKTNNKKKTLK